MIDRPAAPVIAVVDDDQTILQSLGSLLESADYAVRLFASATALLESSCLTEINCLISDICMPTMDGIELLRVILAARPELPVIVISGQPDVLQSLATIGTGHYRIFKKPFNGEELLTAVSDALQNPRSRQHQL